MTQNIDEFSDSNMSSNKDSLDLDNVYNVLDETDQSIQTDQNYNPDQSDTEFVLE